MADDTDSLLAAVFDLASVIHDCRNSATWLPNEKIQLGTAFDKLTTRATLIKLHQAYVDERPAADRAAAHDQIGLAGAALASAQYPDEKLKAIGATFATFDLLDKLLPALVAPFLT